jgi:site-specific recombinase XerD
MLDLQGFQLYLMRMERSENTITSYLRDVASFTKWYDATFCLPGEASSTFWYDASSATIHEMTLIHYKKYLNQKENSVITANRKLASVNAFCRYLYDMQILPEIYAVKLTKNRDKPEYKGLPAPDLHTLRESILASGNLMHICIIELLLATGIRVSELTGLTMTDITLSGQNCIRVMGKGSVYRTLPLNDMAVAALVEYLIVRGNAFTDRLLVGQRGPLGRGAVEIILGNYGKVLGINVTPHMLRHSLAYQLIKSGVAMTTIQQILGHESILTTNLYTQTTAQDKADALSALVW